MAEPVDDLTYYKDLLEKARNALDSLSVGAQTSLSVEGKNYSYETRGDLANYVGLLESKVARLEGRKLRPFMSWGNFT